MCGICGTYIFNKIDETAKVDTSKLIQNIEKLIDKKINAKQIYSLRKEIQNYKLDINFLNYFQNIDERKRIKKIIYLLKYINKKLNSDFKGILNDYIFSLEVELQNRYKFVKKNIIKKYNKNNNSIIFLKVINSIINSINYLEMRGRDSLGLCIQIKIKNFNFKKNNFKKLNYYTDDQNSIFTFVYKSYNSIGILRQNSKDILNKLLVDEYLFKLLNLDYEIISIFSHTRWASVGKINQANTHPIADKKFKLKNDRYSFTAVNGDIYNYKEIIDINKNQIKYINTKCEADSLALSIQISNILDFKNIKKQSELIKELEGSFCSCSVSDKLPGNIFLVRSGQQGLYIGNSIDRYYFSSDVYGLVEESNKFYKVDGNCFFTLPTNSFNKLEIVINNDNNIKIRNIDKFRDIEVSLSDIFLGKNPHYYLKEFKESPSIIQKTNAKYINLLKENNLKFQELNKIKKLVNEKKLKKIIITGMGTCYTAAVAISQYMRDMINNHTNLNLVIQPHIASEGSGFYTNQDMSDHIVIILGQSGTTVDTNTYAKLAKDKGAYTVSFLNKRQGDLSYLVETNLYIGDGRDVEISVPSTKTYLAHVVLGYIFTLIIIKNKNNNKKILEEKKKIESLPKVLRKEINSVQKINFKYLTKNLCINPKWFILYDDSKLSVTYNEIKIKLSELCYHSIPTYNIKYFLDLKIHDSVIIINSSEKYINLNSFLERNNKVIILSTDLRFNLIKHQNLFFYYQKYNIENFELFNSIIFFQYFAYELAIKLNQRFEILHSLFNLSKKDFVKKKNHITSLLQEGLFNQGGLSSYLKKKLSNIDLSKISEKEKSQLINKYRLLMRPIDTVKHQAKTITVGATRNTLEKRKKINKKKKNILTVNKINNCFLFSNTLHESYIYDLVNILNIFKKNKFIEYQLARPYDLNKISNKKLNFIDLDLFLPKTNKKNIFLSISEYEKLKNLMFDKIKFNFNHNFIRYKYINKSYFKFFQKIKSNIINTNNIKILGSGVNYNAAKLISVLLTDIYKKPISYEILENHKHIDVSAEPLLIILLGNIESKYYHNDAFSEIIKFCSHNNKSIVLSDSNNINYYKKLPEEVEKFEHKKVSENLSFSFYLDLFSSLFDFKKLHNNEYK